MSDRWRYDEGILLLEARAIVKAAERIANSIPQSHCRSLILGDNMSVTLSFGRWRAREFKLLVQLRRVAALGLARGIKFYFRWHPSEFNNADEGSRRFDLNFDTSYSVVRDLRNQPPVKVNLLAQDECTQTCSDTKSIGPDSDPACFAQAPCDSEPSVAETGGEPSEWHEQVIDSRKQSEPAETVDAELWCGRPYAGAATNIPTSGLRVREPSVYGPAAKSGSTRASRGCRGSGRGELRKQRQRHRWKDPRQDPPRSGARSLAEASDDASDRWHAETYGSKCRPSERRADVSGAIVDRSEQFATVRAGPRFVLRLAKYVDVG